MCACIVVSYKYRPIIHTHRRAVCRVSSLVGSRTLALGGVIVGSTMCVYVCCATGGGATPRHRDSARKGTRRERVPLPT